MYVCSAHQDQKVSAKGKGCTECAKIVAAFRERKAAKKLARQERNEYIRVYGQTSKK